MSYVFTVRNVNEALREAIWRFRVASRGENSRNGRVLRLPGVVVTEYLRPWERLCFNPVRGANHVFHLMETIWMLAGGRDVEWLLQFNSKFGQYAEDSGIQHGAYGYRWAHHFGFDQIEKVCAQLRIPGNRRVVLSMWDPVSDLGVDVKDVPCNTHIYFDVVDNELNMTVCNRSNDVIWGAYGANAVHFSILQELIAHRLDVGIGTYNQVSNNFHIYVDFGQGKELLDNPPMESYDYYASGLFPHLTLLLPWETFSQFREDCEDFIVGQRTLRTSFMRKVALPLKDAYLGRKNGTAWDPTTIEDCDWKYAFQQWAARRAAA